MALTVVQPTRDDVAHAMLGLGDVTLYSGSLSQKGYGIGGILKRFAAAVKPIFTKATSRAAQGVKRGALGVVGDALRGDSVAESIKRHAASEGRRLLGESLADAVEGEEPARKRRKTAVAKRSVKRPGRRLPHVSSKGTIFG